MTQLSATPTVSRLALHRETVSNLMGSPSLGVRGVPAAKSKNCSKQGTCAISCGGSCFATCGGCSGRPSCVVCG
jgi:hypothetical protein